MKKWIALLLVLTLTLMNFSCLAEEYEVGGDTMEEAVQRMTAYTVTEEDGNKLITVSDAGFEYHARQSENGIAFLPMLISASSLQLQVMLFTPPAELDTVTKVVIYTDTKMHTIVPNEPWTPANSEWGFCMVTANAEAEAVLMDVWDSKNIAVEFFNGDTSVHTVLTDEQCYIFHQYKYAFEHFFKKNLTTQEKNANAFVLALLGPTFFPYTVTSEARELRVLNGMPEPKEETDKSAAEELREWKSLLDDGIISQDEYEAKKAELLGQ